MSDEWTLGRLRAAIGTAFSGLSGDLEGHRFWRHQQEAVAAIARHLSDPASDPRASVVIPTGGGKTSIFGAVVNSVAGRKGQVSPAPRIVTLVPSLPLAAQVLMEFRTRHPDVDIGYLASRTVVDKEGVAYRQGARPTTVMTYALFMRLVASGALRAEDVDLIVLDEAHRGLSELRREVFEDLFPSTMVIGFSATPAFDEERSLNGLMGRDNLVYTADPQRLRDEGILAPVVNYVLAVRIEGALPDESRERQLLRRKAHADETLTFLERHVDAETGIRPLDKVTVFYGSDRAHAALFAREYNARFGAFGKRMEVLTGDDGPERIHAVVEAIERGTVTGIANAQLLVEGFDLAKIGLVINSPTESMVKVIQQAGRAQRIDRSMPFDDVRQTAFVLDTYLEIDGVMEGSPRWYYEAAQEVSRAYSVSGRPIRAEDIDVSAYLADDVATSFEPDAESSGISEDRLADPPIDTRPSAPAGTLDDPDDPDEIDVDGYRITSALATARYLLRKRQSGRAVEERTDDWRIRSEILKVGKDHPSHRFFDELDLEFAGRQTAWIAEPVRIERAVRVGDRTSDPVSVRMALLRVGTRPVICYHVDCIDDLLRVSGAPLRGSAATAEWTDRRSFAAEIPTASIDVLNLLRRMHGAFLVEERLSPDPEGVELDGAFVRMRRIAGEGASFVAFHREDVPVVARLLAIRHGAAEAGEFTQREVAARLELGTYHPVLRQAFETLRSQAEAGEPTRVNGTNVPARLRYANGVLLLHLVGDAAVDALSAAIDAPSLPRRPDHAGDADDLPERTEAWLTRGVAFGRLRTTHRPGTPLGDLWARLDAAEESDGVREVAEGRFRFRLMRAYNRVTVCLHEDDLEAFRAAADDPASPIPVDRIEELQRPEGWHSLRTAGPYLEMSASSGTALARVWKDMAAQLSETGRVEIAGRRIDMRMLRTGPRYAHCLGPDDLDWLAGHLGRSLDRDLLPAGDDDLDRNSTARALGMSPTADRFEQAWTDLQRDLEAGHDLGGIAARLTRPLRAMVIARDSLQAFADRGGLARLQPGYVDPRDVLAKLREDLGPFGNARFQSLWKEMVSAQSEAAPEYRLVRFVSGKRQDWALAESDYPRLRDALLPPPPAEPAPSAEDWTTDWLDFEAAMVSLGADQRSPGLKSLAARLLARQEQVGTLPPGHLDEVTWNGILLPLRSIATRARHRYAIERAVLPLLAPHLVLPPEAGGGWKPLSNFGSAAHADHARALLQGILAELEALPLSEREDTRVVRSPVLLAESFGDIASVEAVPVSIRVGMRRAGAKVTAYVHNESWKDLARLTGFSLPSVDPEAGFVSREETARRLGLPGSPRLNEILAGLADAHAATLRLTGEDRPLAVANGIIRLRRVALSRRPATLFHEDDLAVVAGLAGLAPLKTDEWLDRNEAAFAFRVSVRGNPTFCTFWDDLSASCDAGHPVRLGDRCVRVEIRRKGAVQGPCLHRDDVQHVVSIFGFVVEEKTADWVDRHRAAGEIGVMVTHPGFDEAWRGLMAQAEAREATRIGETTVTFRKVLAFSATPYCIRREDLGTLAAAAGVDCRAGAGPAIRW